MSQVKPIDISEVPVVKLEIPTKKEKKWASYNIVNGIKVPKSDEEIQQHRKEVKDRNKKLYRTRKQEAINKIVNDYHIMQEKLKVSFPLLILEDEEGNSVDYSEAGLKEICYNNIHDVIMSWK